jgi:hypothetical protein
MADVPDSKSGPRKRVWVQVPSSVLRPAASPNPCENQLFCNSLAPVGLILAWRCPEGRPNGNTPKEAEPLVLPVSPSRQTPPVTIGRVSEAGARAKSDQVSRGAMASASLSRLMWPGPQAANRSCPAWRFLNWMFGAISPVPWRRHEGSCTADPAAEAIQGLARRRPSRSRRIATRARCQS